MSGLTPYGNLQRAPIGRANPNESGGPRLMRSNRAESDSLMRQWGYTRSRRKRTAETTGRQPVVPVETDTRTKNKTDDNDIPGPKKVEDCERGTLHGGRKGKRVLAWSCAERHWRSNWWRRARGNDMVSKEIHRKQKARKERTKSGSSSTSCKHRARREIDW